MGRNKKKCHSAKLNFFFFKSHLFPRLDRRNVHPIRNPIKHSGSHTAHLQSSFPPRRGGPGPDMISWYGAEGEIKKGLRSKIEASEYDGAPGNNWT